MLCSGCSGETDLSIVGLCAAKPIATVASKPIDRKDRQTLPADSDLAPGHSSKLEKRARVKHTLLCPLCPSDPMPPIRASTRNNSFMIPVTNLFIDLWPQILDH
jgi:hypothetical protein